MITVTYSMKRFAKQATFEYDNKEQARLAVYQTFFIESIAHEDATNEDVNDAVKDWQTTGFGEFGNIRAQS